MTRRILRILWAWEKVESNSRKVRRIGLPPKIFGLLGRDWYLCKWDDTFGYEKILMGKSDYVGMVK